MKEQIKQEVRKIECECCDRSDSPFDCLGCLDNKLIKEHQAKRELVEALAKGLSELKLYRVFLIKQNTEEINYDIKRTLVWENLIISIEEVEQLIEKHKEK